MSKQFEISASLVTFTRIELPYPTAAMLAMGVEDWPEPMVLQGVPSINDVPRRALLERMAMLEKEHSLASQAVRDRAAETAQENRRLKRELEAERRRADAQDERYTLFVEQVLERAARGEPSPAIPESEPVRRRGRAREPGLSPAGLAAARRLMDKPVPEPGSFEPEDP